MKTVVIFGGSGFIGKHIIRRIARKGYKIIVPYQRSPNLPKLRLFGNVGQIVPIKFRDVNDKYILYSIEQADLIINLKTTWSEKKISFKKAIYDFNANLVNLINKVDNKKKFVFFSGLGIDTLNHSKRSKNIADTEEYIKKNLINASIIRPGIIIGGGDQFLKKLIPIIKISPIIPIFGNGMSQFQPVYVDDVAKAIETLLLKKIQGFHIYEFFSFEIYTYKDFYNFLCESLGLKRFLLPIPFIIMEIVLKIMAIIPFELLSKEQLNLFKNHNLPTNIDKNLNNLDVEPQSIREIIKISLKKTL